MPSRITRATRRSASTTTTTTAAKSVPSSTNLEHLESSASSSRRLVLQPSHNSENSLSNMNSTSDLTRLQNTAAVTTMTMTIGGNASSSKIIVPNDNQNNNDGMLPQSLPAKRSLSDRSDGCGDGGSSNCVTAPSSPGSNLKGRNTRSNSHGNSSQTVPPSPSRNTRAARASARANAKERTASESLAADDGGSPDSTGSTNSNGGRSSKRAKLDHPPPSHDCGGTSSADPATAEATTASAPARDGGGAVVSPINPSKNGRKDQTATGGGGDESRSSTPTHKNTTNGGGSATSIAEVPPPPQPAAPSTAAAGDGDGNSTTSASASASAPASASASASSRPQSPPPPLKSLTMHHLRKKYLQELEYMSVEFRKLEKQLLGARGGGTGGGTDAASAATAPSTESAASRERREKLHSFIVHLEDTIQQIKDGCLAELEDAGADTATAAVTTDEAMTAVDEDHPDTTSTSATDNNAGDDHDKAKRDFANSAALTKLTREKEQEETVQKLEEHILANLLPVKVRLTKQLAAQQGATRNPAGMPTSAHGPRPSAAAISGGKGTFAAAAEERRKREEAARLAAAQQRQDSSSSSPSGAGAGSEESTTPPLAPPPAPSILGKPLKGGGSSLTARLHGATLGSKARTSGHGIGQAQTAVQSPRAKEPSMTKIASTTTEDSFDSTSGESGESGQPKRKILFAGMTPGSEQVSSSVSAAQGAHKMVVTDPTLRAAHRAGLAAEAIEEGAGALASLSSSKIPPPPPATRGTKAKAGVVRPSHPGAPKPALVASSGSDSSNDAVTARGASTRSSTTPASRSTIVPAGPASAAVAKVQAQQVATAAQLAARAKARAAAGLPPLDTPVTSSAAAELRRTGKKSTANRGKKRRLSEKNLTDEEKERLIRRRDRRQRRRKKAKRLERERIRHAAFAAQARQAQAQQSAAAVAAAAAAAAEQNKAETSKQGGAAVKSGSSKSPSSPSSDKKAGPRTVEYICGLCNEVYVSTCDANPWWCLRQQDCPKCGKRQVPRIDISAPANSIQYHPALLAHAEDSSSGGSGGGASVALRAKGPAPSSYIASAHLAPPPKFPDLSELYESESEASDDDEAVSLEGDSSDESEDDEGLKTYNGNLSPAERAEAEDFGTDYAGPKLKDNEASRLLILMGHAQCCPGRHKVGKMREVCQNTKFMMMHVRDCPGTTSTFDVCPFPWCRKVKHLLYHLVSCEKPEECSICTPTDIPPTLKALRGLNAHRHKKHREKLRAAAAAAASARATATKARAPASAPYVNVKKGAPVVPKMPVSKHPVASTKPGIARHPGAPVPNPTLSSKSSAKVVTKVAGKATAVQPRHPGSSRPAPTVAKSAIGAKVSNYATAKGQVSKPVPLKNPGAPTNSLKKEVPVPLRGSTPNPILPTDSMEDSGIVAKTSVVPPNRPATKSPTPLPVSNPLEPPKPKAAGAIITGSASEKKFTGASPLVNATGGDAAKTPPPPPARGDTPPENGCAGEAAAKASAESARLVEE